VKQQEYSGALELYELALQDIRVFFVDPSVVLLENKIVQMLQLEAAVKLNKALCLLKLGDPHACIQTAKEVEFGPASLPSRISDYVSTYLKFIPQNLKDKAKLRLVQGYVALQDFEQAEQLIQDGLVYACTELKPTFEVELKKVQKSKQKLLKHDKKKWSGFFDKLEAEGGYMTKEDEANIRKEMERERDQLRNAENVEGSHSSETAVTHATCLGNVTSSEREQLLELNQ